MKYVFKYLNRGTRTYPVVDITLFGPKNSLTLKALVDSGASFSVFRPEIAEYLGIDIEKGEVLYLEGIGGRILGYMHWARVLVGKKKFTCKIIFSREFTVSLNIIGRDNFFNYFKITFNEQKKLLVLE